MYLLERLVGVSAFSFVLLVAVILVSKTRKIHTSRILFCYCLLLSIMAYYYVPNPGADLYRIWQITANWESIAISDFLHYVSRSSTPISEMYIYLVVKFGNKNLLPALTAYIYYLNLFYIVRQTAKKYDVSSRTVSIILLFVMSSGLYVGIISGIRNHLAFSIVARCIYTEIHESKLPVRNIPLYLIAALMHNAALALVSIRFFFLLFQEGTKPYVKLIYFTVCFTFVLFVARFGSRYWYAMIDKSLEYLTRNSYSYFWGYIIGIILIASILWLQKKAKYMVRGLKGERELATIWRFSRFISAVCLVFIAEYNIFIRFTAFLSVVSIPWMMVMIDRMRFPNKNGTFGLSLGVRIIAVSLVLLILACTRGDLSSFKLFLLE